MAAYQYIVKDTKGVRVEGIIKASNIDEAVDKLSKKGNTIIRVQAASKASIKDKMSLFDKMMFTIYKLRTGVRLKTLVFFTRQLSTMFSAGLTLERSISNLSKGEKNKRFKNILIKVSDDIKKGYSLSEAMEQHPGVFNPLYISLVRAGEVSGTLHTVLDELANYLESIEETRRKVWSAVSYPLFVVFILAAVLWGMFYYIIPMFTAVYESFNADLPGPTQAVIAISKVVKNNLFYTLLGIISFLFAFFLFYLSNTGKKIVDGFVLRVPIIGKLLKHSYYSKFSRTFSILMSAGLPITETFIQLENVIQNAVIQQAITKAKRLVKEGFTVAGAFRKSTVFPSTLLQLIETGEETGDMDKLLGKAAEFHQKILDSVVDRLTSLLEPLLIIIMAAVIGSLIVIIYLPIFYLGLAMSSGLK